MSDLPKFDMIYLWKRRSVISPSAPQTDREEHLYILWNRPEKGVDRPTKTVMKDPILRGIWLMKTGWCYAVSTSDKGYMGPHMTNILIYQDKKAALEEYKRRVKTLTRSKEIDYGEPWEDTSGSEEEDAIQT